MKLYNSYCYATLQDVADSIQSSPLLGGAGIVTNGVVNVNAIDITYRYQLTDYIATVTPPDCSMLGFNNSYSGLTFDDSVELSGLGLLVLVTAFAIKVLKRGL